MPGTSKAMIVRYSSFFGGGGGGGRTRSHYSAGHTTINALDFAQKDVQIRKMMLVFEEFDVTGRKGHSQISTFCRML